MYKLILQKTISSDNVLYNLIVSKHTKNNFNSNLDIVGKLILSLKNKKKLKKLIIYKFNFNNWLSKGLQLNFKIKQLLKQAGYLY